MKNDEMRRHLIQTTAKLLSDVYTLEEITVRKIAEESHVATGLINYYFKSKEDLLIEAVRTMIDNASNEPGSVLSMDHLTPAERLRGFIHGLTTLMVEYKEYSELIIKYDFLDSSFSTARFLEEMVAEIHPQWATERVKYQSVMLLASMQYIFVKEEGFKDFMGYEQVEHPAVIDYILKSFDLLEVV